VLIYGLLHSQGCGNLTGVKFGVYVTEAT
jgi:hypothetical protein